MRLVEREPEGTEPRAWLFTVATNLFRDHGRVHSRRLELLRESPESTPLADPPLDPHHELEQREREESVRELLAALPERDREILLLQHAGFSHREIAEAVDTTTGSVGTMLARALRRFRAEAQKRLEQLR